jgi:hypothetical protein
MSGKLHVLIRAHDQEDNPHWERESPPRRIMHDLRLGKLMFLSASLEYALL